MRCTGGESGCASLVSGGSLAARNERGPICDACLGLARRRLFAELGQVEALEAHDRTTQAIADTRAPRRSPQQGAPRARPSKQPQGCPPPLHVAGPSKEQCAEAERVALRSHQRAFPADAGRRDVIYWAAWVRVWFRRGVQTQEQAGRELSALPEWWQEKVIETAKANGGLRTSAGRHVVMYAALVYWHARHGYNVISGLSQEAWASLSVGTRAGDDHRHYSTEYLFHNVHDGHASVHPTKRGPRGGAIGLGNNCGLISQLERDELVKSLQPDGRCELPSWMVGRKGWAFGQLVVLAPVNEPDDMDRTAEHERTLETLGVRILGPS